MQQQSADSEEHCEVVSVQPAYIKGLILEQPLHLVQLSC